MPSNRIGYGYGTYGDADFGVEGVTQTGSASISASASGIATGAKVYESGAAISSSATTASACVRVVDAGALVSSTASTASIGEEFVLKEISGYSYGTGAYGSAYYGEGPLDTVSTGSASTTSAATRVRLASATSTASASTSSSAVTVVDGVATVSATSTNTATGSFSVVGSASGSATATNTATCIRRRKSGALISSNSSTASIAREKWEPITAESQNWVTIADISDTWTRVA